MSKKQRTEPESDRDSIMADTEVSMDIITINLIYSDEITHYMSPIVTGGGTSIIPKLLGIGGASRSIACPITPYSKEATDKLITPPYKDSIIPDFTSYCSEDISKLLADSSRRISLELFLKKTLDFKQVSAANIIGISCSSSIKSVSDRPGRKYNCYVTVQTNNYTRTVHLELGESFERSEQEKFCSQLILNMIDVATVSINPIDSFLQLEPIINREVVDFRINNISDILLPNKDHIDQLLDQKIKMSLIVFGNDTSDKIFSNILLPEGTLVIPGSYNPFHIGHYELAVAAFKKNIQNGKNPLVVFEITLSNVDKGIFKNSSEEIQAEIQALLESGQNDSLRYKDLIKIEIDRRINIIKEEIKLFDPENILNYAITVNCAGKFIDKSDIYRNCIFVIGYDTVTRIIDCKYYKNNIIAMNIAIGKIIDRGCTFLIAGRKSEIKFDVFNQEFWEQHPELDDDNRTVFEGLTEEEFRNDISSTEIRLQQSTI